VPVLVLFLLGIPAVELLFLVPNTEKLFERVDAGAEVSAVAWTVAGIGWLVFALTLWGVGCILFKGLASSARQDAYAFQRMHYDAYQQVLAEERMRAQMFVEQHPPAPHLDGWPPLGRATCGQPRRRDTTAGSDRTSGGRQLG